MIVPNAKNNFNALLYGDGIGDIFRLFCRVIDSMLFVVDNSGRLCLANENALRRLGYEESDIVGHPFVRLVEDKDKAQLEFKMHSSGAAIQIFDSIPYLDREKKKVFVETRVIREKFHGEEYCFIASMDMSRLKASEEKFFKAFHSSSVIMVVFTVDDGLIIDANEAAFKMTGYSASEMIGKTIVELDLYPDKAQRKKVQMLIKDRGHIEDYALTVKSKSGETRYALFSMDPLTVGHEDCVLAVGSDFTKRKMAEQELQKAYTDLERAKKTIENEARLVEESSRHKSEFLASMSHELRTPLNSIILLSDLLARNSEGRLSEKEGEYASIIKSAGKDLLELINDILDISRVEAGRMEINLSRVSMEYFCRKIGGYFTEMAGVKGLGFDISLQNGLTDYFVTDIQKLEQIVKNLISNAIKFTEKGSVTLSICRPDPAQDLSMIGISGLDHDNSLAFSVKDTGIGIPEDKKDYIFELFRQADNTIHGEYGGTGLGLPLSRVMAQLLGGDILVDSHHGKGSVFTLYIPERSDESISIAPAKPKSPMAQRESLIFNRKIARAMAGKKLIIADDDMRTTYSLIQNLEIYEPEISVAADGKKCLELVEEHPDADLLLLDLAMPVMDGLAVLRLIRKNPKCKKLPVIVVTARAMEKDEALCLAEGADAFMSKPLDMEKLVTTMSQLLTT